MKNKILLILVVLILALLSLSYILYTNNQNLIVEIEKRDDLIKKSQLSDSLNCAHTENYIKTVTEYITRDCSILIDNKKVSLDEFIKIYSDEVNKSYDYQNNILQLNDSIKTLTRQLEFIKKKYSVEANTKIDGNYKITSAQSAKIDSALMLLPYYRDRLIYDSVKNEWKVIVTK